MPPKIAVHQFNSGITARDGLGNTMFFVQELLRGLGFDSEIYVEHFGTNLKGHVRLLDEFVPSPNDILLIHHSFLHEGLSKIERLPSRKVLVYHSITPPKLYQREDRLFTETARAYSQISRLGSIVEASIAVSPYNARQLRQRGFANVTVIPFHKDFATVRYGPHRKVPYYDQEPVFRLLYVGRVTEHKCQHQLIEVVGALRSIRDAPLELVVVGHAEHGEQYKARIDQLITGLDLCDRVIITGSIPDDELYGHYRAANAFVSFSEHEGFGVPLMEAMTLDLPVIAYGAAAVPDTIGDAGILIGDKEPETVFRHLLRLHDDRRFRSDLIRKQRERVLWYARSRIEGALRQWLRQMGALREGEPPALHRSSRRSATEVIDFEAVPAAVPLAASPVHYVVEGPFETSYSLACDNREIARALNRMEGRAGYIEPAEGVEDYQVNLDAARRLPREIQSLVRPLPLTVERTVTIRQMHPPRPNGMLGDVRLMHLPWEESAIPASLAEMINIHSDGVVVASEFCKRVARSSGVRLPIAVIGDGIDHFLPVAAEAGVRQQRAPISAEVPFTFLHISSGLTRKGIEELLIAYCLAFTSGEPVLLVIKTFPHDHNVVFDLIPRIAIGKFAPAIQVIAEELEQHEMQLLYRIADAAILPTRGDGFCYPAAEAMARGIPVIITGYGGQMDFCNPENAALIDFDFELSASHLNVPNSLWMRASIPHLVELMKASYRDGRGSETPSARRAEAARQAVARLRWTAVADRIDKFVSELDQRPLMSRRIRIAWVSPYNARDGIATNSQNLLPHFSDDLYDITILANNEPVVNNDPPNLVRLWTNRDGTLDQVKDFILTRHYDAVYIQFHFSFYNIDELATTLKALHTAGIDTYLALHRTKDHDEYGVTLREISETLKQCTRLFVHGVDDVNRLKEMEIIDNVVLMPPGVIDPPQADAGTVRTLLGLGQFSPIVGTFGFIVPPKGFQALIHALALIRQDYPNALLLMVTAQNPNADSAEERERCFKLIRDLGLQDSVKLITDFIDDEEEVVFLLGACDCVVFPYLYSLEAASGAIRIGLAAGRPVGSTPLSIFTEFEGLVHQFTGTSAVDVANGIRDLLRHDFPREEVGRQQRKWIATHSWAAQARRVGNIMLGCFEERHGVALCPPLSTGVNAARGGGDHLPRAAQAGNTLRGMIEAEFRTLSKHDLIGLTFRRAFGRDPTPEELARFELDDDLATAASRWRLVNQIFNLAESTGDLASYRTEMLNVSPLLDLDSSTFADAVFRQLVLRDPEPVEREHYLAVLKNIVVAKRQLVEDLIASPELRTLARPLRVVWGNGEATDGMVTEARIATPPAPGSNGPQAVEDSGRDRK